MRLRTFMIAIGSMLVAQAAAAAGSSEGELRIGAGSVRITPPAGVPMAGYYHRRTATGVHDHLHAKSIVLERGGTRVALVALDLIHLPAEWVRLAREEVERRTSVPADRVMISATHAHTGPVIPSSSRYAEELGGADAAAMAWARELPGKVAESVSVAVRAMVPGRVRAATGHEDSVAFNRRFHMSDGTVGWNPGKGNPRILRPAGPIDPAVPVVRLERPDGAAVATYVSYALHLDTVGGLEISSDYPHTLAEVLGRVQDDGALTVFTIGCAGDINHLDVTWPDRQKGHREAARIGSVLAGAVIETFPRLTEAGTGPLGCRSEVVRLALRDVTEADVVAARDLSKRRTDGERIPFLDTVRAFRVLDIAAREGRPLEAEVQVVTLGTDIAWVALPGEIFVELGLAIRRASPFPCTAVVELAGGSIGYVPTRQAYTQGNYEVVSARCAAGSGERLVEAASRLLREAHREAAAAAAAGSR